MSAKQDTICPRLNPAPLTLVLIGGLAKPGELSAEAVVERAEAMGLNIDAAARAVNTLMDERLVRVQRDDAGGKLIAAPALAELSIARRVRGVVAYLAQVKGMAHA